MDWKDRAILAYQDEDNQREQRLRANFQMMLEAITGLEVTVDSREVTIDNITFSYTEDADGTSELYIKVDCPKCGQAHWSSGIKTKADLGRMLLWWKETITCWFCGHALQESK